MGIYLPNMEMPKDGELLCINIYPDGKVCINLDLECKRIATAVPVPDHGRLVDASEVEFEICESTMPKEDREFCRRVINSEILVHTIIPADGGDA